MYAGDWSWRNFLPWTSTLAWKRGNDEPKTYCHLVQAHLKPIILFPKWIGFLCGNADCTLVDFAKQVHFLLILPVAASNNAGAGLDELDVVHPELTRVFVKADVLHCNIVCLMNYLTSLA